MNWLRLCFDRFLRAFKLSKTNFDICRLLIKENTIPIYEKKNSNLRIRTEMFLNLIDDEALKDRMEEIIESVLDDESLKVAQSAT